MGMFVYVFLYKKEGGVRGRDEEMERGRDCICVYVVLQQLRNFIFPYLTSNIWSCIHCTSFFFIQIIHWTSSHSMTFKTSAGALRVIPTIVLKCRTAYWAWWMFKTQWTMSRTWWGFISIWTIQQRTGTGFESRWALGWTWRCSKCWAGIWFVNWTKTTAMNGTVTVQWTVNRTRRAIADDWTGSTAIGETIGWGANSVFHNVCATKSLVYRWTTVICNIPNRSLKWYSCDCRYQKFFVCKH